MRQTAEIGTSAKPKSQTFDHTEFLTLQAGIQDYALSLRHIQENPGLDGTGAAARRICHELEPRTVNLRDEVLPLLDRAVRLGLCRA